MTLEEAPCRLLRLCEQHRTRHSTDASDGFAAPPDVLSAESVPKNRQPLASGHDRRRRSLMQARLIGMAKLRFSPSPETSTPTTCPFSSTTGTTRDSRVGSRVRLNLVGSDDPSDDTRCDRALVAERAPRQQELVADERWHVDRPLPERRTDPARNPNQGEVVVGVGRDDPSEPHRRSGVDACAIVTTIDAQDDDMVRGQHVRGAALHPGHEPRALVQRDRDREDASLHARRERGACEPSFPRSSGDAANPVGQHGVLTRSRRSGRA